MFSVQRGTSARSSLRPSSRGVARAFTPAEPLERRALMSAVTVGITPASTAAGLTYETVIDEHDGEVMVRPGGTILAPLAGPFAAAAPAPAAGGFNIVLNKGPNLLANPLADAAFEQAAAFMESRFSDPITVAFDVEIRPLGGNTLGQASSIIYGQTFDAVRNRIVNDRNAADEAFVSGLPTGGTFLSTMPGTASFTLNGMSVARANLLALGANPQQFPGAPSEFGGVPIDATIIFSSQFPFDYDRSNGISFGQSDFIGVAIHEIGHAMGFNSAVDQVDARYNTGGQVAPMPMDLFRFRPGTGSVNFAGGTRILAPGQTVANQVFYDGGIFNPSRITSIGGLLAGDVPLSTGVGHGDGNQASHWKDDGFVGTTNTIGLMDPIATNGVEQVWSAADERALALVGWDAAPAVVPGRISGTTYQDSDGNGVFNAGAGDFGLGSVIVYQDVNNDGQFNDGIAQRFVPAEDVPLDIPDPGIVTSEILVENLPGTVRDVNVTVSITHPFTFDLEATLISPGGRQVTLFDDVGQFDFFGQSHDFSITTLDDEAFTSIEDGEPPYNGFFRPQEPLSEMDGETMNGTWRLRIRDWEDIDEGTLFDWGLTFDTGTGEPHVTSDFDGTYAFEGLAPGTYTLRQVVWQGSRQTQPVGNAAYVVNLADGQQVTGRDFGMATGGAPASSVVGRHVFYNNSSFDGHNPAADAGDDAAIAVDKAALRSGQASSFANVTSYSRGINGIMVDVADLPAGATLSASDFGLLAGNDPSFFNWEFVSQAPTVSVRRGAGVNGSDRVTLTWPDGTLTRRWLQVTVQPNANTGLTSADVFYFGNLPGEVGDSTTATAVTAADVLAVRSSLATSSPVTDRHDFNRDGRVNAVDQALVRANAGRSLATLPSAGSAAPTAGPFGDTRVPPPSRSGYRPPRAWDEAPANLLA